MKKILVIAGPSAVGKTTVMAALSELCSDFEYIRSATTRAPRGDGRDSEYIYLTRSEFKSRITAGEMLEYTEYSGNLYGTPVSEISEILENGKFPLLVLDINGVISFKKSIYADSVLAVYLWDELSVLEGRLRERISLAKTVGEGEKIFNERMAANISDYERVKGLADVFDGFVQNKSVEETAKNLLKLFKNR